MSYDELLLLVSADPQVCGGAPCIRGTGIHVSAIMDSLAAGLTPGQIVAHHPQLTFTDLIAALAYAAELTRQNLSYNRRVHRC